MAYKRKTCKNCGKKIKKQGGKRSKKNKSNKKKTFKLYSVGGGCACGGNDVKLWGFGGGTGQIPIYPLENQSLNPNNFQIAGRNVPDMIMESKMGGGKKHRKKASKKTKRMTGGLALSVSDPILGSNPNQPITSFGTTTGAFDFYNLSNMSSSVNPAPYVQPVLQMYGSHNQPLV
jgi:hypothetical protein